MSKEQDITAVSYTHLDVYKRQALACLLGLGTEQAMIGLILAERVGGDLLFSVILYSVVYSYTNIISLIRAFSFIKQLLMIVGNDFTEVE